MPNVLELTQARAARLAGALYLLTNLTAAAGFATRSLLVASADAATAARRIAASERLYRVSIALDLLTVAGVVALIWTLYLLLRPVSRQLALLGLLLRLVENVILAVSAAAMLLALRVGARPAYLAPFSPDQLDALARLLRGAHGIGFNVAFVFLGFGALVLTYLLLRSRYVPTWLAGFSLLAASVFTISMLGMIVLPGAAQTLQIVGFVPMGIHEVGLGGWLWLRGARLDASRTAPELGSCT